ncbi:MAG: hemolysin III family protein [Desulfobacterales bacterium]|nr:hemolysin III family protein [Desulfobacterales bacterium]
MCILGKIFREPVNALSHMAGSLASLIGLTVMVVSAALGGDIWQVVSFSIFGSCLVLMYTSSFLYHGLWLSPRCLLVFRRIDHMMIFLAIAGTYTPICLLPLRGPWGWSLFGTVWAMAFLGIILKLFFMNTPRWVSTSIYLIMGWSCIVAIYPLVRNLSGTGLFWLVLGGGFYSMGAVIYALKRPNPFPRILGFHEIWHMFVLLGSSAHFWLIYRHLSIAG